MNAMNGTSPTTAFIYREPEVRLTFEEVKKPNISDAIKVQSQVRLMVSHPVLAMIGGLLFSPKLGR